jgi:hypothetical protein
VVDDSVSQQHDHRQRQEQDDHAVELAAGLRRDRLAAVDLRLAFQPPGVISNAGKISTMGRPMAAASTSPAGSVRRRDQVEHEIDDLQQHPAARA